jgi:hypothetical protein
VCSFFAPTSLGLERTLALISGILAASSTLLYVFVRINSPDRVGVVRQMSLLFIFKKGKEKYTLKKQQTFFIWTLGK